MKTILLWSLSLLGLLVFNPTLKAQIPQLISFQGILTDAEGNALPDGNYQIEFRLFDDLFNGGLWWAESQEVFAESGLVNVYLGAVNTLSIPFDRMYFVEMVVNGEALSPRSPLTSSPYSLNAANVSIKDLNLQNDNIEGGSVRNSLNTRLNLYSNNNAYDSPAWIELWGDNVDPGSGRNGELTLSGRYHSFWIKSSSSSFGQGQMFISPEGRLGLGTWPGTLFHMVGSDTTDAILFMQPYKWDSNEDLTEIWMGDINTRIVSRFGDPFYFFDSEGYTFSGGNAYFDGGANVQDLFVRGFSSLDGPDGNFAFHPYFGEFNGTTLLGAFSGKNGNAPQIRFGTENPDFIDIGMNNSGAFVVEYSDGEILTVNNDGAQIVGNLNLTGAVIDGSSRMLKHNIAALSSQAAIEAVMNLTPVTYNYIAEKDQDLHVGFIAEDVPEILSIPSRKGISSMDVTATLTKVVQEQQKMIEALQAELENLKIEIKNLKNEKE